MVAYPTLNLSDIKNNCTKLMAHIDTEETAWSLHTNCSRWSTNTTFITTWVDKNTPEYLKVH